MLASHWSMSATPSPHVTFVTSIFTIIAPHIFVTIPSVSQDSDSLISVSFSLGRCLEMSELVKFSPHCFQAINCNSNKSQLKQSAPCLKIRNF